MPMIFTVVATTALLAADPAPNQPRVKVLNGTIGEFRKAELEHWISQAVGEAGEDEKPAFQTTTGRTETRIRTVSEGETTVIDITSKTGIDKATIKREATEWPKSILVRLHLGGLESFKAGGKGFAIEWSVSSTGNHEARSSLVSGKRVADIKKDSPYFTEVRIVGGEKQFPLKDGHFEVPLPAKLFEGNPQEVTLEWIDFYRR